MLAHNIPQIYQVAFSEASAALKCFAIEFE